MSGISAVFNGIKLNDLDKWSFRGNSSPQVYTFPRCVGALLRPSKDVGRQIILTSQRFPPDDPRKTDIERLQHELNECIIQQLTATLTVDGIAYTDATPIGVSQDILSTTEWMSYSLIFELSKDQVPFESTTLKDGRVRDGFFIGYEDAPPTCGFPIFDNWEAAINVAYEIFQKLRISEEYGTAKKPNAGYEVIALECWMVGQTEADFQMYIADYLFGPLGKIGTLNLNGLIFENAILVGVDSTPTKGASLTYKLTFNTTLQCCP